MRQHAIRSRTERCTLMYAFRDMRSLTVTIVLLVALSSVAGVKVAGVEFVPKDLIFAAAEPKSQATAEGPLPGDCKWNFTSETRIGRLEEGQMRCIRYYYKTMITLQQACSAPNDQGNVVRSSERITSDGPYCPDTSGKIPPPKTETHVISSGTTAEGKHQDILTQPDGTRITLLYDDKGVVVAAVYVDGTGDVLKLP